MSLTIPDFSQNVQWVQLNNEGKIASSVSYASQDGTVLRFDNHQRLYTPSPGEVFHKAADWVTVILYDNGSVKLYESENAAGDHILLNFAEGTSPADTTSFAFDNSLSFGPLVSSNVTTVASGVNVIQEFSNGHLTHYDLTSIDPANAFRLQGVYNANAVGGIDDPKILVSMVTNGGAVVQALADTGNFDKLRLITNDGGSLISNDGASLITNDGGSLRLISNDGASLITNDGGSLITNDGGSLKNFSVDQLIGKDAAKVISNDGSSIVSTSGAGLIAGGSFFDTDGVLRSTDSLADPDAMAAVTLRANTGMMVSHGITKYTTLSVDEGSGTAPGSDAESAIAVTIGAPVTGDIVSNGDAVWYEVTLTGGTKYIFDLKGEVNNDGTLSDPFLKLLDVDTGFVDSDDDDGAGLNSKIVFTPTSSGTYYLVARGYNDASHGTFKLSALLEQPNPEITSNGGGATATIAVDEGHNASDPNSIGIIEAWDDFDGTTLTYSLSGVDAGDFDLNPTNGILSFHLPIDYENPHGGAGNDSNTYHITVTAEDSDGHTDSQDITVTVNDLAELIYGTNGNDTLDATHAGAGGVFATNGADWLFGLDGDDSLDGGGGNDTLIGGAGNDTIVGGSGEDTAAFTGDHDDYTISAYDPFIDGYTLTQNATGAVDTLRGVEHLTFDDGEASFGVILGTTGIESINGTAGDDVINPLTGAGDAVNGQGGIDRLYLDWSALTQGVTFVVNVIDQATTYYSVREGGSGPNEVFYQSIEAFTIHGSLTAANNFSTSTSNADVYFGGILGDTFNTGSGDDIVDIGKGGAATGFDSVTMGAGDSDLMIADYSEVTADVGIEWYSQSGAGTDYASHPNGTGSYDGTARLSFSGVDRFALTGGSGNDYFKSGDGDDTLIGGAGDDILESGKGKGTVAGGSNGTVGDKWSADLSALGAVTLDLNATGEQLGGINGLSVTGIESLSWNKPGTGIIWFTTGAGADDITTHSSGAYADAVWTTSGSDTVRLYGGATAGVTGFDTVDMGTGDSDLLVVDYSAATVGVSVEWYSQSGGGTDYASHPNGTGSYDGTARLSFSGVDRFALTGGSGNDYFKSGDGDDTLIGGAGDDILESVKGKGTIAGGSNGAGGDRWSADLSTLGAVTLDLNATGAQLTGVAGLDVTGIESLSWNKPGTGTIWFTTGAGADDITTHSSGAYADSVWTSSGSDIVRFYGGATAALTGFDDAQMGAGDSDLLSVDYSAATVSISVEWYSQSGGGTDYASHPNGTGSYAGTARLSFSGVDRFALTGGSGNDYFKSGDGDDTLIGSGGDDTLESGKGTGTIAGGTNGAGGDRWSADLTGLAAVTLNLNSTGEQLTGVSGLSVTGIEALSWEKPGTGTIAFTTGTGADEIITHASGLYADTIRSGSGSDTIRLYGGATAAETGYDYADMGGGDSDLLVLDYSAATVGVSVDWYSQSGGGTDYTTHPNGTGSYAGAAKLGFSGVDRFDFTGGVGNDYLHGGDGADTFKGNGGNDTVDAGGGSDTVIYSGNWASYSFAASGANVTVTDTRGGSNDGVDFIQNAENFQFANGTIAFANLANVAPTDLSLSNASVAENSAANTVVGALSVTDANALDAFTYSLTDDAGGRFAIAGSNIVVANGQLLDREASASHAVTVRVTDAHGLTYDESFTISLGNVNETIGAVSDADTGTNHVAENSAAGTAVGITATAADLDGQSVTYSLDSNAGGRFTIDATTGIVRTTSLAIDREADGPSLGIVVRATSADTSSSTQSFTIAIDNVNEPIGAISDVNAAANHIAENTGAGAVVGITAFAGDPDGESVSYSLDNTANGRFIIDAATGIVRTTAVAIDRETDGASLGIVVRATSSGGGSSTQAFSIAIDDVNEATQGMGAVTDADIATNHVAENALAGIAVGITAVGVDPDTAGAVHYSLDDSASGHFAIDAATGVVTTTDEAIDREIDGSSLAITVRATSPDGTFSTQTFAIAIDEVRGGTITGTDKADRIDAKHTVKGQPKPSNEEDIIKAKDGNDTVNALGGNDSIDGGAGKDHMLGGQGNDIYVVDSSGDLADETGGDGLDLVKSSITFSLADTSDAKGDIEQLLLTGKAKINGTGNALDNLLTGNKANNLLTGNAGNDTIDGGKGNDTLVGGAGIDQLTGGAGKDVFKFIATGDSGADPFSRDIITDFAHNQDRIDLSLIDAVKGSGNQKFTFDVKKGTIEKAVAQGHIGWYWEDNAGTDNDHTVIKLNVDKDATIESTIELTGLIKLTADDFIL